MARRSKFPRLSAEQAHAALRWLHALGKVRAKDISHALAKRDELVSEIRNKLVALGADAPRFFKGGPFPLRASRKKPSRRRRRASPAARKAWQLQGQYLGALRPLALADRAKIKAIREKKGVVAAVAAAKKMA